jgi:hypothetical protein
MFRRIYFPLLLGAALVGSALPAVSQSTTDGTPSAQMQEANRNSEAYRDGFLHWQTDASNGVRNDQPSSRWASSDDQMAYQQGYQAGYQHANPVPRATSAAATTGQPMVGPSRYGYDDGLANGRKDKAKGDKFKPTEGDMYKHADHGWSADFGDKDHYKQVYRQAYTQGYQEGYNGGVPH